MLTILGKSPWDSDAIFIISCKFGCRNKTVQPFRKDMSVIPPSTLYNVETWKFWLQASDAVCGVEVGMCHLKKCPQKQIILRFSSMLSLSKAAHTFCDRSLMAVFVRHCTVKTSPVTSTFYNFFLIIVLIFFVQVPNFHCKPITGSFTTDHLYLNHTVQPHINALYSSRASLFKSRFFVYKSKYQQLLKVYAKTFFFFFVFFLSFVVLIFLLTSHSSLSIHD